MASTRFPDFGFNPELLLNDNETDLLLAALNANRGADTATEAAPANHATSISKGASSQSNTTTHNNSNPYLDFDTAEGAGFDWNLNALPEYTGEELLSGMERKDSNSSDDGEDYDRASPDDEGETGEKRKNSAASEDNDGAKRHESESKDGKKQTQRPGRKPLTSEPTTKRKAQNRAAQRAFRERKEKHLKDLETQVDELQKASESTNHENGLLRAQVDRLQTELKEYRKRLSLTGNNGSPTAGASANPYSSRTNWDINNNFNFEFPKFGGFNDGRQPARSASGNAVLQRQTSKPQSPGSNSSTPVLIDNDLSAYFSPSSLASTGMQNSPSDYSKTRPTALSHKDSTSASIPRTDSNGASPACSSQPGFTSSCATTPEASCDTPDQRKDPGPPPSKASMGTQDSFSLTPALTTQSVDSSLVDFNGLDWLANQNGGVFDPILFGDYREPQNNIMSSDFNFFSDALFPSYDYAAGQTGIAAAAAQQPAMGNTTLPPAITTTPLEPKLPPKKPLMQEIEDRQAGKEPEVAAPERQEFLTCNLLWDRVQRSAKVQSGEADMDDLCTQLKAKAKCSGSGAVISQSDVDAILGPAAKEEAPKPVDFMRMFR